MKRWLIGSGIVTTVLALSMTTAIAQTDEAPPVEDFSAQACALVSTSSLEGRAINLWICGSEWHGQIASAAPGDSVYFSKNPGAAVKVPSGGNFANTKAQPTLDRVCGHILSTDEIICTADGA